MAMNDPIQFVFPFAPDENYCLLCKGYDKKNPKCLFPHKLGREVVFIKCQHCKSGLDDNDLMCSKCFGRGYTYFYKERIG